MVIRLGISYPELTEMQARAIFEAAITMSNQGIKVFPEIMVPLVGTPQELAHQTTLIRSVAEKVFAEMSSSVPFKVGTMIEIPRATLIADEVSFYIHILMISLIPHLVTYIMKCGDISFLFSCRLLWRRSSFLSVPMTSHR